MIPRLDPEIISFSSLLNTIEVTSVLTEEFKLSLLNVYSIKLLDIKIQRNLKWLLLDNTP